MYRLYAQKQQGGWDKISTDEDLGKLRKGLLKLYREGYYSYIIIKNDGNGDEIEDGR